MAETIKEFTNAEITQASLSNDGSIFTVFTNDANTTRVVREVQVQDSPFNSGDATFEVGVKDISVSSSNFYALCSDFSC